jgi:hypothetical protein
MKTIGARGGLIGLGSAALAVTVLGLTVPSSTGFPRYRYDNWWWGCEKPECHGSFTDHSTTNGRLFPSGGKHGMHRNTTAMNTDCRLCHPDPDDPYEQEPWNPWTLQSEGTESTPGLGCLGCHGRDYGGDIGITGAGLRARHINNGYDICLICHIDDMADPEPLPESVPPPYHGSYDTKAWDSCNEAPWFGENFSLETDNHRGLDNDGDGLYDADEDPDCGAGNSCAGDCDGDGQVGINDFLELLGQWGGLDTSCDFDGDGVGITDFLTLLGAWGLCP